MTTKTEGAKTARVAAGGGHLKAASNGMTPSTLIVADRNVPHAMWAGVSKKDIGTGYAPVDLADKAPVLASDRTVKARNDRDLPRWKNQFVKGTSKFIWFYVNPKPVPKKKPKKKEPFNFRNKLEPKTQKRFQKELTKNMDATANLMVNEILPISLSLLSGLSKADELVQQMVEDKVSLPRDYLIGKAHMAANLRIIRFVSETFGLTEEERKLMALEYTRPWSQT